MAQNQVDWLFNNDMLVTMSGLQTSTMAATEYLNSSTGLTVNIYNAQTTASTSVVHSNVLYSTLVNSGNGGYQVVVHSTEHSMTRGTKGVAITTLGQAASSASDAEWRVPLLVRDRGTT